MSTRRGERDTMNAAGGDRGEGSGGVDGHGGKYTFVGLYALCAEVLLALVLVTTLLRRPRADAVSGSATVE